MKLCRQNKEKKWWAMASAQVFGTPQKIGYLPPELDQR